MVCNKHAKNTLGSLRNVKRIKSLDFSTKKIEVEPKKIHLVSIPMMTLYFVGPVSLGNFVGTILSPNLIKFKVNSKNKETVRKNKKERITFLRLSVQLNKGTSEEV